MMNENTGGVSKRSLILLGAFAALALNKDLRRGVVYGTRDALDTAHNTLDETIRPALSTAAQQAGHTLESLREEGPQRAHSLLDSAQGVVGTLAATAAERALQLRREAEQAAEQARREYSKQYAPRLNDLQENLADMTDDRRHQAAKALMQARRKGIAALSDLGDKVSHLREDTLETVDDHRRDAERAIARARRQAERELNAQRKNWNPDKLQREVEKRIAPVHKQVQRELVRLEKEAGKGTRRLQAELPTQKRKSGMGGGVGVALLVGAGAGAYALTRVPEVRRVLKRAQEGMTPEFFDSLGQKARAVMGEMWMEDHKPAAAPSAPAPAPKPAAPADAKPTDAKPADAKPADAKPAEAPKADAPKTEGNTNNNTPKTN